jgi:hypothetical protein
MKRDFSVMSRAELRAYFLANRQDIEAFHELVDRVKADPHTKLYAPEDANRFSEIYEAHQNRKREQAD